MPSYSRSEVVLVRVIFSNQAGAKIRPAVIVSGRSASRDLVIVPPTSKTSGLLPGEFVLANWKSAGLNVSTALKRGLYTIQENIVLKSLGALSPQDVQSLDRSLRSWLELT
jgi:mRNA interferase MazF